MSDARSAEAFASGAAISIAGEPFYVAADDIERGSAVASVLRGFGRSDQAGATPLVFLRDPVPVPRRISDITVDDLELWVEGGAVVARHESGVVGRAVPDAIVLGGAGRLGRAFRRLFLPLISYTLGMRGVYVLHGAAVSRPAGALLVLGSTGSGKSTVAAIGMQTGWRMLADDMFAIRPLDSAVQVIGLPRPPAIPADVVDTPVPDGVDQRGRVELDPTALEPGFHPVLGCVLPRRGAQPSARPPELLDPVHVVHALVGSLPGAIDRVIASGFMPLAGAVARLPAWQLDLAPSPRRRRADVAAFLDDVAMMHATART